MPCHTIPSGPRFLRLYGKETFCEKKFRDLELFALEKEIAGLIVEEAGIPYEVL
jgi:hypothetical protein